MATDNRKATKILRVIHTTNPSSGGPIEGIKRAEIPLKALGVEVEILCSDLPDEPWLNDVTLPKTHAMGPAISGYGYNNKLFNWLSSHAHLYDVIIIHGLWQHHGLTVRRALKGKNIPYFVFTHGMLDPWFKKNYPFKHLKKSLYWYLFEYKVLRDAAGVIFTSEEERILSQQSFSLYKVKENVTSYGTAGPTDEPELLKSAFYREYPSLKDKRIFLFMSRIHKKKGCDLLIEAFSKIHHLNSSLHLVIAGPDQEGWKSSLMKRSSQLGIHEKVTWTGMLTGDVKWGAYYSCEVFCLPSHQENFGIVVAEALACGKPVLISNKINIWREIINSGSGFVDDDNLSGTLNNMQKWLQLSIQDQMKKGGNAKLCFAENFHIDKAAARFLEIVTSEANDHTK